MSNNIYNLNILLSLGTVQFSCSVVSDSLRPHRRQPTRLCCPWDSPGKNIGVGCHFFLQCMKMKSESEVAQSCLTLCNLMDCSPPGSSVHGDSLGKNTGVGCHFLLQGSSQPRDGTQVSRFAGRFLTVSATREALLVSLKSLHSELPTPAASICLFPPAP